MTHQEHQRAGASIVARLAVVTLSDTRTRDTDGSGPRIQQLAEQAGHQIVHYQIMRDEPAKLAELLKQLLARADVDVILTNGGTGISPRDRTLEVVQGLLEQALPGFGELFRMLSWQEIGSAAMLSRAMAGIARGKVIFALPGSTKAVELAMTKLILPELGHLLAELRK
jgi:molybdenum cofactor biosynthesis protein B